MSSDDVEYIEQANGALLATRRRVSRNGGAVRVRSNAQISKSASAPVPEVKSKKHSRGKIQEVAPGEYVRPDKSKKQQVFMYVIFYVCAIWKMRQKFRL